MYILLLITIIFGYFISTRVFREKEILNVAVLSLSLGIVGILFFVNPLFYHFSLETSVYISLGIMACFSIILKFSPGQRLSNTPIPRSHIITLIACCTIIILFTLYLQVSRLDDDYWIHTPLMGLYLKGQFPPVHPFFPYIELPGHYGRDLSIAAISVFMEEDFLKTCWIITTIIQPLIFLMIYIWIRSMTGNSLQALFCAIFIFFGVNMGSRTGLFDIIQNNNSFVYLYLFLIAFSFFKALQDCRAGTILLCIGLLAIYPVVYESHYGLLILSFICISLYMTIQQKKNVFKLLLICLLIISLTIPIALLEGGFFTSKLKALHKEKGNAQESIYETSNTQKVSITFPKKELFQIYLGPGMYQRISVIFPILFPWLNFEKLSSGYKYAPVWSPSFLILVWFPFYLAPFTLILLFWKKHIPGLFLWIFGFISFLVPAVVNFGPVFEEEYFRWEGAAGIGFAGALGICITYAITFLKERSGTWRKTVLRKILWVLLVLFIIINLIGAASYFNLMLVEYERMVMKRPNTVSVSFHGLPDPISLFISYNQGFYKIDAQACAVLRKFTCKQDTLLRNFEENEPQDILAESTISGLAGVNMMGHTFPPFKNELRASPFRMNMRARAFWNTGDTELLKDMSVHWLYVDRNRLDPDIYKKLKENKDLKIFYSKEDESGQKRAIFEYIKWEKSVPGPCPAIPENNSVLADIEISEISVAEKLFPYSFSWGKIQIANKGKIAFTEHCYLTYKWRDANSKEISNIFDRIQIPISLSINPGEREEVPFYLVTPFSDGLYDISFYIVIEGKTYTLEDNSNRRSFKICKRLINKDCD